MYIDKIEFNKLRTPDKICAYLMLRKGSFVFRSTLKLFIDIADSDHSISNLVRRGEIECKPYFYDRRQGMYCIKRFSSLKPSCITRIYKCLYS